MKNLITIILYLTLTVFAEKLHINFNDGTTLKEYDFRDIANIEIVEVPIGMVFVQGGTFSMGDEIEDLTPYARPVHSVTVSDFNIGKYEVTQYEWEQYMSSKVSRYYPNGGYYPAYGITWYEMIVYCNKRSIAEGLTPCYRINASTDPDNWGIIPTESDSTWDAALCNWYADGYRLPSEAEWEYAARGGIHWHDRYFYSGSDTIDDVAWFGENNNPIGPKLVGLKDPNQLGIYDMSGNLWEWCWDWSDYPDNDYYQICDDLGTVSNPYGPDNGTFRVGRGGRWYDDDFYCRVAMREFGIPFSGLYDIGFRIARTP